MISLKKSFMRGLISWLLSSVFIWFSMPITTLTYIYLLITFFLVFIPVFILSLFPLSKFINAIFSSLTLYIGFPVLLAIYPYLNLLLNPSIPNPFLFLNPKQILDNQVNSLLVINDTYIKSVLAPLGFYYFLPIFVGLYVADKLSGGKR